MQTCEEAGLVLGDLGLHGWEASLEVTVLRYANTGRTFLLSELVEHSQYLHGLTFYVQSRRKCLFQQRLEGMWLWIVKISLLGLANFQNKSANRRNLFLVTGHGLAFVYSLVTDLFMALSSFYSSLTVLLLSSLRGLYHILI